MNTLKRGGTVSRYRFGGRLNDEVERIGGVAVVNAHDEIGKTTRRHGALERQPELQETETALYGFRQFARA